MDMLHDRMAALEDDLPMLSTRLKEEMKGTAHMGRQYQELDRHGLQ